MNIEEIDIKHRILPISADYNRGIFVCPSCRVDICESLYDNAIGFMDTNWGVMIVIECPKCFSKWYFHGDGLYQYFLDSIELGTNKHYK